MGGRQNSLVPAHDRGKRALKQPQSRLLRRCWLRCGRELGRIADCLFFGGRDQAFVLLLPLGRHIKLAPAGTNHSAGLQTVQTDAERPVRVARGI
jgi:hypothetical protein